MQWSLLTLLSRYGDALGEEERLAVQALLGERLRPEHVAVEVAYLAILTRRPSEEEYAHFEKRLRGTAGDDRKDRLTDLCWTLLNATEFSWNH